MGKLDAALAWAARGFRVFPLQENSKNPTDLGWTLAATTDEATIRGWWTDPVLGAERNLNVGFCTTGWVVADVDVKDGKPGLATMARLGLEFDTLTTRTAGGGYHLIYRADAEPVGQSPLGPGVDVRAVNGYVVAPGSTIDGRAYAVEIDGEPAAFPGHLRHALKPPRARKPVAASVEEDAPETVELAAHWLLNEAPPAVQGQNGDDTTFRVACRLRDFGVSEHQALELFLDEYNPRCEPPWSLVEARAKIENAYRYAKGDAGASSPAALFEGVAPVAVPEAMAVAPLPDRLIRFGNMKVEADIPMRPWVVPGLLIRRGVTVIVAPPGAGKSLISMIVAAHLAVGLGFAGYEVLVPGKSVIYNAEDDLDEMSRRMNAICTAYGLDHALVASRVALMTSEDVSWEFTAEQPPRLRLEFVNRLMAECAEHDDIAMLAIDPLIEVHTGRESDSGDMKFVMSVFRMMARRLDIPLALIHHTGKAPSGHVSLAGSMDAARGSSAILAAARIGLTMFSATEAECVEIGAPIAERLAYVRVDGSKATALSALKRGTRWFRWHDLHLASGETVGVLKPHDALAAQDRSSRAAAEVVCEFLVRERGGASCSVDEALDALVRADPLTAKEDRKQREARLRQAFAGPVRVASGGSVMLLTEGSGRNKSTKLVLR